MGASRPRSRAAACLAAAAVACPAAAVGASAVRAAPGEAHPSIELVRVDTGKLRRVLTDATGEGPPLSLSWTADAGALVYGRAPCDACAEIRLLRLSPRRGGLGVVLAQGRAPALSPDGRTLVFVGADGGLYSTALAGGRVRTVIPGGPSAGGLDQPRLAPDNRRIAFMRAQGNGRWSIDVVTAAAGSERRLTPAGVSAVDPAWSPDGRTLAFSAQGADGRWRIELVSARGGAPRLIRGPAGSDSFPTWSPDGKRIAFVRQRGSDHSIYVVPAAGGRERRLTPLAIDAIQPAWSPRGDEIAFVANAHEDD